MSRISQGECPHMDMEWYAVDSNGNIAVFCSAGCGNLPEFVCEDRERADRLMELFEKLSFSSECKIRFDLTPRATEVAEEFSKKGLFYYDSDDCTKKGICTLHEYYTKVSYPLIPLNFNNLSEEMQKLLKYNIIKDIDFSESDTIYLQHAYE